MNQRRAATQQALERLAPLMRAIPAAHRNNPHELAIWLRAAGTLDGLSARDAAAIADATAAVGEWREAAAQSDDIARLYYDPQIRKAAEATGRSVD